MTPGEPDRPDPDALLAEAGKAGRGRLKVFFGSAPGVGKTYAMLEEARARRAAGIDVVIALIETHGRPETAALLDGLEQLPRRDVPYRGRVVAEMDLDALLARRPQLAIIDEFAHTNAPGGRHTKRWQDVTEVLDAGIDVVTTLNVQHVESLNDVVAGITGVRVQETVPDDVLARADDIELIDLTPEELAERLKEGKVYVPAQAGLALDNFFSRGNLTALRELALRTAASHVDADVLAWMRSHGVRGPWPTQDRLLVCLSDAPTAKTLVRAARRMADRARIPWIAVTVSTPRDEAAGAAREHLRAALRLAETLGGEAVQLRCESNVAGELLAYARKRNATRLVIGRPLRTGWRSLARWLHEPVFQRVVEGASDFEVTIVTPKAEAGRPGAYTDIRTARRWRRWGLAAFEATAVTLAATVVAWPLWRVVPVGSLAVVYLFAVLLVGVRNGLAGALPAALTGFLAYNFFFTTPYYTFLVAQDEAIVALLMFLISAVFTGTLAGRLKMQVESMRASQRRTETLYDFARKIASVTKADDVLWAAAAHIATTLNCRSLILMPDANGRLEQVQGHPSIEEDLDTRAEMAAQWAFTRNEPAGAGTDTLPTTEWLFVPLATAQTVIGVVGVWFHDRSHTLDPDTRRLLTAVEDQVAVAVERLKLTADLEARRLEAEGEKLRAALLNSVSHDLRTPLVSVIGALTGLADADGSLPPESRRELTATALDEARRLNRFVQNLLDMTRLGYGALTLRRSPVELREIVGRARADLARPLAGHPVEIDIPRDTLVDVDPVLIGQAVTNVLENAAKYAPPGTPVRIAAATAEGRVTLSIGDQGPGIPPEDAERVFDLFYRVRHGDGEPAGTGLGLAIVRGLVEAHGGSVRAHPGDGSRGTVMELVLPAAVAEPDPEDLS
ncbi:Osmosensitive K+ channel histidine kinase KdpD [Rhodovulum sp. PH10]|uniref:sensor histidine kinase n=1 Tax=Rhodovulum sp. PH10 TaxID=1187851 RepID=UPI00027C2C3B|nr:sensor histidine kinase KdpD [Rhodovulum sp. PH10]EJW11607.1 Osmosensitive K+ channel histidine kinase KdpD [Rhodovulum sp. PH10]